MNLRNAAGALPFAHLAGLARTAKPPRAAAGDDTQPSAVEEEEDDEEEMAEGEDTQPGATGDDSQPGAEGEEDEDEMEEEEEAPAARAARGRERTRIHGILTAPGAAANIGLAAHLAFETGMPQAQAIGILNAAGNGTPARGGLAARMQGAPNPQLGAGAGDGGRGPQSEAAILAASVGAAMAKARGKS